MLGRNSIAGWPGQLREGRKQFFFEKKNQKTFTITGSLLSQLFRIVGTSKEVKVFWFFFSKKNCLPSFLAFLLLLSASPLRAEDPLFAQLGGEPGIARIANAALDLYFTDPRIAGDFDNINRAFLQPRFTAYLCRVAGGPCIYKGHSMKRSHKGLGITQSHFNAVVEDLETAMDGQGVPYHVQNKFLARLAPMERDIVTR